MKDNTYNASSKQDYTQLIENQRKLAEYIKTCIRHQLGWHSP